MDPVASSSLAPTRFPNGLGSQGSQGSQEPLAPPVPPGSTWLLLALRSCFHLAPLGCSWLAEAKKRNHGKPKEEQGSQGKPAGEPAEARGSQEESQEKPGGGRAMEPQAPRSESCAPRPRPGSSYLPLNWLLLAPPGSRPRPRWRWPGA